MTQDVLKPETDTSDHESVINRFRDWLRVNLGGRNPDTLKKALEEVLEEHEEEGAKLPEEEQRMLKKMLNFGVLAVSNIMTRRADIKAVEFRISLDELRAHLTEHFHTRIPVYNDTLDNIKGFIHVKDLIPPLSGGGGGFSMALVLRDILFVPPSMKLPELLARMRKEGVHIAIVIDEYGGVDGLVTLEDIFEQIFGDIQDEHDEDESETILSWAAGNYCDVDARVRISKLERELKLQLTPKDEATDYDTLGGLIFYQLGHVPVGGETIEHESGVRFEILSADPRSIKTVRVFTPASAGP